LKGHTIYLLYPFAATIIFTFGALFLKKASNEGAKPFTPVLIANVIASILFSAFWVFPGQVPSMSLLWQPALIALFYILGQSFILNAVSYGDVSVAAPVASSKVIIVPLLLMIFGTQSLTTLTWVAAVLAMGGVILINYVVPESGGKQVLFTAALALGAAVSFASFDVGIQSYAPAWGVRFVPISYWFVGLFSLLLIPLTDLPKISQKALPWRPLLIGCFLVALQACFLVYALSTAEDAARINVVYSLRGLWGVVFAWLLADWFGGNETNLPRKVMVARLLGATVLAVAVIIVIVDPGL
jgi:drug/metabolite transporter (DMT)-like permease